jgi:hypothetical protein
MAIIAFGIARFGIGTTTAGAEAETAFRDGA